MAEAKSGEQSREGALERLQQVKYVGPSFAEQVYENLAIQDVEGLIEAAEKDWLRSLKGIGPSKQQDILEAAREHLGRPADEESADASEAESDEEEADENASEETGRGTTKVRNVRKEAEEEASSQGERIAEGRVEQAAEVADGASDDEDEAEGEDTEEATAKTKDRPRPRIDRFLDSLRCPACGHDVFERRTTTVRCTACQREYEIHDGVADLGPSETGSQGLAQKFMESRLYARFYENVARPKLTSLVSDRTMQDEKRLSADFLELEPDSTVLDVACGTGNFTRYFTKQIAASQPGYDDRSFVVGMDISWPMLERARTYLRREGLSDRIFLLRGDATRVPLRRASFDRVHCTGALHMMDDIDEALRNLARVLEPGGICVVGTFLLGDGLGRRVLKRLGGVPASFHWFEQDELYQRMENAGLEVTDESISRDAITVKARRS